MLGILSSKTSQESDRICIENGTPSVELMYRAANALFSSIDFKKYKEVLIVAGPGNNGGDGIALASILKDRNIDFKIFFTSKKISEDGHYFYNKIKDNLKKHIVEKINKKYDLIVDSIFGVGLKRELNKEYVDIVKAINKNGKYIVSCDIPSGLSSDNGLAIPIAVKANETIAISDYKLGHFLNDAKDYVGLLKCVKIGIKPMALDAHLVEKSDIANIFKPRKNNSNKHDYGRVVIIGGSLNFPGAIQLAHLGFTALKLGAGLVSIAFPNFLYNVLSQNVLDATLMPLSSNGKSIKFNKEELDKIMKIADAILIGPGLSICADTEKVVKYILVNYTGKLLLDADAITIVSKDRNILKDKKCDVLFTPHIKEAERLFKIKKDIILQDPISYAKNFAKEYNVKILLKGPSTIITDGDKVYITNTGNPCMSKGGNGDVLSGVILGLLSQNNSSVKSLYTASFLTGLAGDKAKLAHGEYSVLASEIPNFIKSLF